MIRDTRRAERGQGAVEWILILAFIIIVTMILLLVFRNKMGDQMGAVNDTVSAWSDETAAHTSGGDAGGGDASAETSQESGSDSASGESESSDMGSDESGEDGAKVAAAGVSGGVGASSGAGSSMFGGLPEWFFYVAGAILLLGGAAIAKVLFDDR